MRLLSLFADRDVGSEAAHALGEIVETDAVLTKENNAVIKVRKSPFRNDNHLRRVQILYAQKYFNAVVTPVLEGSNSTGPYESLISVLQEAQAAADEFTQTSHLIALASLIKSSPTSAYIAEMPRVSQIPTTIKTRFSSITADAVVAKIASSVETCSSRKCDRNIVSDRRTPAKRDDSACFFLGVYYASKHIRSSTDSGSTNSVRLIFFSPHASESA